MAEISEKLSKTEAMRRVKDEVMARRKCGLCEFRRENGYFPVIDVIAVLAE